MVQFKLLFSWILKISSKLDIGRLLHSVLSLDQKSVTVSLLCFILLPLLLFSSFVFLSFSLFLLVIKTYKPRKVHKHLLWNEIEYDSLSPLLRLVTFSQQLRAFYTWIVFVNCGLWSKLKFIDYPLKEVWFRLSRRLHVDPLLLVPLPPPLFQNPWSAKCCSPRGSRHRQAPTK